MLYSARVPSNTNHPTTANSALAVMIAIVNQSYHFIGCDAS